MALGGLRTNARFLTSRVARRIFALFLACAVIPLGIFGYIGVDLVTSELTTQSRNRLRENCISLSRHAIGRLEFLDSDLRLISQSLKSDPSIELEEVVREGRRDVDGRFEAFAISNRDGKRLEGWGEIESGGNLSESELAHLAKGHSLLRFRRMGDGRTATELAIAFSPDDPEGRVLWGTVRDDHIWGDEWFKDSEEMVYVLTESGVPLSSSSDAPIDLEALRAARNESASSGHYVWSSNDEDFLTSYRKVYTAPIFHSNFVIVTSEPTTEALAPVKVFINLFLLTVLLTFVVVAFLSLNQIRRSLVPIEALKGAVDRFRSRDFDARVSIKTRDEFKDLGDSFNEMIEGHQQHVTALEALNKIGVALTSESDPNELVHTVIAGARRILNADTIALYLRAEDGALDLVSIPESKLAWALSDKIRVDHGESGLDGTVARAARENQTLVVESLNGTHGQKPAMMTVPLNNHEGDVIGVLVLLDDSPERVGEGFSVEECEVAASLASQAAVAISKNELVRSFRALFDGLSELIAAAIDEKSPYTGGHCRRVPILTMMLADAACTATEGRFKDYSLTDDELYELRTAALLHDCGKVSTPVHVVDKATKLETLFDRVALVRTRFELLKRDAEISALREATGGGLQGGEKSNAVDDRLKAICAAIDADRKVVEHWNIGGEFMAEEHQQEIKAIAERYSWVNHEGVSQPGLSEDEVLNLCVSRGTLTTAERQVINEHVSSTIRMLENLPYPKNLTRVPEIAGAHHERMDGKGYPLGLKQHQLDLRSRMLGLSDVFEALTAKDRPYKPGKTLTETLDILGNMSVGGHVDPDLFQLFIETGTYMKYAEEYLDPAQIDEVDLAAIPGYNPRGELQPSSS